jgi:hypothetical protein
MPKLLFFVPCERVIISKDGPISLITLLEGINTSFSPEEEANLADDSIVPITWHVVTKWQREDNEEPQHWEQRLQVILPNGRIPTDVTTAFDLAANSSMRNILEINGFAVRPIGQYSLSLSLRKVGEDDAAWQQIATYPIKVENVYPKVG